VIYNRKKWIFLTVRKKQRNTRFLEIPSSRDRVIFDYVFEGNAIGKNEKRVKRRFRYRTPRNSRRDRPSAVSTRQCVRVDDVTNKTARFARARKKRFVVDKTISVVLTRSFRKALQALVQYVKKKKKQNKPSKSRYDGCESESLLGDNVHETYTTSGVRSTGPAIRHRSPDDIYIHERTN